MFRRRALSLQLPVAGGDTSYFRRSGYEPGGQRFESFRARQSSPSIEVLPVWRDEPVAAGLQAVRWRSPASGAVRKDQPDRPAASSVAFWPVLLLGPCCASFFDQGSLLFSAHPGDLPRLVFALPGVLVPAVV